jgi:hypothetical protein
MASCFYRFSFKDFSKFSSYFLMQFILFLVCMVYTPKISAQQHFTIDSSSPYLINNTSLGQNLSGGDTIFILSERVKPIKFQLLEGSPSNPIVIINKDGQVKIDGVADNSWGALTFENCRNIKLSGTGHPGFKYGFELSALESGVAFTELSSDCEVENVKISHNGFFGIYAKKDYNGNPPAPAPVFENLIIHDCFIEGVSEGMYIGETKTPGMEFKHLKIYNNIVRNTERESIQIANCVEDVEIYNNTLINAGLESLNFHMNVLQIGDNSVASIYNNIMMNAPDYGIISFGKGNVIVENNYIENSKGVFMDNRSVSDTTFVVEVSQNYFKSTAGSEVIRNMNEKNDFTASSNVYDNNILFYKDLNGVDNEVFFNNSLSQVSEIQFTNPGSNDYSLVDNTAVEYIGIGAPSGPEFPDYDDPATTPSLLIVTSDMVTDNVIGGSVNSPMFLFDEQNIDIDADEHPTSLSWKPFYLMEKDSYHTTVDLGDEHYISQINLHDMNDTHSFVIEYYDGLNWINLIEAPLDNYNVWIRNDVEVSTRYLRFSMYDSPYAAVNEILIYGYPIVKDSQQIVIDSTMVSDMVEGGSIDSPNFLFDEQHVDVSTNEHPLSLSWKPFYNNANAPYHAVVKLSQAYKLSKISLHDMHNTNDLIVEVSNDGENWSALFTEPCDGFNVWQKTEVNVIAEYLRFTMLDSPYASVNEILIYGYPIMTLPEENHDLENQIVVTPDMVNDLVPGGSVDSPLYLFDEQIINPELDEQPVSKNWRPFYNNTNAPYYTTVDFGNDYYITKIYIHDTHSTYDFNIEYEDGSNWSHLLTEPCDAYNVWKKHDVNLTASKLRLSMLDSPYAGVNEIIFVGYPVMNRNENDNVPNTKTESLIVEDNLKPVLFPNPVRDNINIELPNADKVGNQNVKIFDISGNLIYELKIDKDSQDSAIKIDAGHIISSSGLYLLMYKNDVGTQETIKFYKS